MSVFIVEDSSSIQLLYKKLLNECGYEVIGTANNGEEAVNKYKELLKKPDVILMDHRMPVKDGIEASKEILKLDKTPKIILTSADNTIKKYALSIGITSFLEKSSSTQNLLEKIETVLKSK